MRISVSCLDEIRKAAREFIDAMDGRKVFAFYGHMGAGKTTFIKAVCEELGVEDVINSPTFAILNEYQSGSGEPIYHFDFYRLKAAREFYDLGFDDYVYSGYLCFIEWPERIEEAMPDDVTRVIISEEPDGSRTIEF